MEMNLFEKFIPFVVVFLGIYFIYKYRHQLRENIALDKWIRIVTGVVLILLYSSHYLLRINLYGIKDPIVLPFQLCSISMFLAIILLFTKNKTIFAFTFFAGILGAFVSYLTPIHGYTSAYYRYYQFYIAHGILILTPIYYLLVHQFYPSFKDTIHAFLILQSLAIFMGVYNYFYGTDFMFIFVDPAKIDKFPLIAKFGGIPYYIIWMEIVGFSAFLLLYILVYIATKRYK